MFQAFRKVGIQDNHKTAWVINLPIHQKSANGNSDLDAEENLQSIGSLCKNWVCRLLMVSRINN